MSHYNSISVIICCYNSASRLPQTLRHLSKQKSRPGIASWEIIIVDNGSSDNTEEAAYQIWRELGGEADLRVVKEPCPGVINARKKGVSEAKHEYLLFCDDDNWLDKNYLQQAVEIMAGNDDIGALGGQSEAVSDTDFPEWFEKCKMDYAVGRQGERSGDVSTRKHLWGAGLTTRKSLMEKVFDPAFPILLSGRQGKSLTAGDDSEICARLLLMTRQLHYSEALFFKHYIPSERLTNQYRERQREGFHQSYKVLPQYFNMLENMKLPRWQWLKRFSISLLKSLITRREIEWQWLGYLRDRADCFEGDSNLIYRFHQTYRKHRS